MQRQLVFGTGYYGGQTALGLSVQTLGREKRQSFGLSVSMSPGVGDMGAAASMHWRVGKGSPEPTAEQAKLMTTRMTQLESANVELQQRNKDLQANVVQNHSNDASRLRQLESENIELRNNISEIQRNDQEIREIGVVLQRRSAAIQQHAVQIEADNAALKTSVAAMQKQNQEIQKKDAANFDQLKSDNAALKSEMQQQNAQLQAEIQTLLNHQAKSGQ